MRRAISVGLVAAPAACAAQLVPGHREVSSQHGTFRYQIPEDWESEAANAYGNREDTATVLEQIYPPAEITEAYCGSFLVVNSARPVSSRLLHNGAMPGCYSTHDYISANTGTTWRYTSFRFAGPNGVEDVTVVMRSDVYDPKAVMAIINSVRTEP